MRWTILFLIATSAFAQASPPDSSKKERALGQALAAGIERQSVILNDPAVETCIARLAQNHVAARPDSQTLDGLGRLMTLLSGRFPPRRAAGQ